MTVELRDESAYRHLARPSAGLGTAIEDQRRADGKRVTPAQ
ncbi:hypothetical protein [Rhodoferax sp.]|nr:hypothetical protein [Rhodoferax sp.]